MSSSGSVNVFVRIAKQLNASKEILSPTKSRVILPGGLNYDAFSHNGSVQTWSLMRIAESTRALLFHKQHAADPAFMEMNKLYKSRLNFIVSSQIIVAPEMYDSDIKKGPLCLEVELDYLKGKAMRLKYNIFVESVNHPVATTYIQSVFVDRNTRRAAEPPKWWMEKYSGGLENKEALRPAPLSRPSYPESLSKCEFVVSMSNCDMYLHANWSTYVKYCLDAWINANWNADGVETEQCLTRVVKNVTVAYVKEANLKDKVLVLSWKDNKNDNLYHFQVLKDGDALLSEASIEYFPKS